MKALVIISNLTSVHPSIYTGLDVAADNVECANFFFFILIFITRITINMQYYKLQLKIGRGETWLATNLVFYIFSFCVVRNQTPITPLQLSSLLCFFFSIDYCVFHF
jgi:hypothetical protein